MKIIVNGKKSKEDQELDFRFNQAVENAIEQQKYQDVSIAKYDETGTYLEYADDSIKREN